MTNNNLAICIAPSFLRKDSVDGGPTTHQMGFGVFVNMLNHAYEIFPNIDNLFKEEKYESIVHPETTYTETFNEHIVKLTHIEPSIHKHRTTRSLMTLGTPVSNFNNHINSRVPIKSLNNTTPRSMNTATPPRIGIGRNRKKSTTLMPQHSSNELSITDICEENL